MSDKLQQHSLLAYFNGLSYDPEGLPLNGQAMPYGWGRIDADVQGSSLPLPTGRHSAADREYRAVVNAHRDRVEQGQRTRFDPTPSSSRV
jgi:hypothetical protein